MSDKINDGGPAFPCEQGQTNDGTWNQTFNHGITIRDYFAASCAQALLGVLKPGDEKILAKDGVVAAQDRVARGAYALADAMIRVRQENPI